MFKEEFWLSTENETETKFTIVFKKKKKHVVFVKKGYEYKLEDKEELEETVYMNLKNQFKDHFEMIFEE